MANGLLALLSALNGYGQGSLQRQQTNQQRSQAQADMDQQQQQAAAQLAQAQAEFAFRQQQFAAQQAQALADQQAQQASQTETYRHDFATENRPPTYPEQMEAFNNAYQTGAALPRSQQPAYFQAYDTSAAQNSGPLIPVPGAQNGTRRRNFGLTDPSALWAAIDNSAGNPSSGAKRPPATYTSPALGTKPLSVYANTPNVPAYNPYFDSDDDASSPSTAPPNGTQAYPKGATPLSRQQGTPATGSVAPMPVKVITNRQGQVLRGVTVPPAPSLPGIRPLAPSRPQGQPRRAGQGGVSPVGSRRVAFLHRGRPITYTVTPR